MSVTLDIRNVHLIPTPHKHEGWDGFFEAQGILAGDASGGAMQISFYFGKSALEDRVIQLDRAAVFSTFPAAAWFAVTVRSWLGATLGYVETNAIQGNVSFGVEYPYTTGMLGTLAYPQLLAYAMPIDQTDPYSVLVSRSVNVAGGSLYAAIKGRWMEKRLTP